MMPHGVDHEPNQATLTSTNPVPPPRGSLTLGSLTVLASLVLTSFLGMNWFLSSRQAANRLETHLAGVLGTSVRVGAASIGWMEGTRLNELTVYEAGDSDSKGPWLTVRTVRSDVAALGWLSGRRGASPVLLDGADITLRFDAEGALLTQLPRPGGDSSGLRLRLTESRITLLQEGRGPLALSGLSGEIEAREGALVLTAKVDDPDQGEWDVTGSLESETHQARLQLRTEQTALRRARLEKLPFVSPAVWRHVRLDSGETSVDFTLNFRLGQPGVHYRLRLEPSLARLHVSSINLDAEKVSGRVLIEDGKVDLEQVQGQTGQGRIGASACLDFRKPTTRMGFQIDLQQVQLQQLPRSWKLPEQVAGRLTGQAQLQVTVQAQVRTTGDGKGVVGQPLILGLPFPGSIPVRLHADGQRFHFSFDLPRLPTFPRAAQ
jgi:hypothetical protein